MPGRSAPPPAGVRLSPPGKRTTQAPGTWEPASWEPVSREPASWSPEAAGLRAATWSRAVLVAAVVAGLLAPERAAATGPWLLVVAGLVGLPHGAVDHLALGWARGRVGPALLVSYGAAAAAVAAVALLAPQPAVLVLLALSAAHFAEGEAAFDRLRGGPGLGAPAAALGTAVVALPLLLHPGPAGPVLATLSPGLPGLIATARPVLLVLVTVLVAWGALSALRHGAGRALLELALVVVAAVVAPPLLVFAAWFAGWHAPRHLVRLAALQPVGDGRQRALALARGAALPTAAAVVGLVGLALVLGGLPGAVLVTLLALTVPHAAVVARLDRLSRVRPAPAPRGRRTHRAAAPGGP